MPYMVQCWPDLVSPGLHLQFYISRLLWHSDSGAHEPGWLPQREAPASEGRAETASRVGWHSYIRSKSMAEKCIANIKRLLNAQDKE